MKTEIKKILNLKKFFTITELNSGNISYTYKKPSKILLQNIKSEWLKFTYTKTCLHFPVYLNELKTGKIDKLKPYGFISMSTPLQKQVYFEECTLDATCTKPTSELSFNVVLSEQDVMQYFMQWQRYRKYWWSSVTTTPSLFTLSDIKHKNNNANVNIIANFDWGPRIVETISVNTDAGISHLNCKMPFEDALFTLLFDALNNCTEEEYLHINRKMAPYKIAIALDYKDSKDFDTLKDLSTFIMHKLRNISMTCTNTMMPLETQIKENFKVGVPYTAVISENTLTNGIFHLLNSSTILKEQLHLADFEAYATLLCGN
ncbi:DNA polymerase subunit gamma-2, mitochondrial [Battus philenor]|uniref:DNA polymerase subunit gamma-2, mitochondrial n=1 Tax=Battus philenor TaxID=42288 RepID=UPI0035CFF74E